MSQQITFRVVTDLDLADPAIQRKLEKSIMLGNAAILQIEACGTVPENHPENPQENSGKPREITTQARRLVRQHNGALVESGYIYWVNLDTGMILDCVASYAAEQPPIEVRKHLRVALIRIGHGKLSLDEAQRFIDELGEGF